MYQSSNGSFIPRFKKSVITESGLVEMEISPEDLDSIINHFAKNEELISIMRSYIELTRKTVTSSLSEAEEIAMGKKIFPIFHDFLFVRGLAVFAPDVAEEMFQRIEKGLIGGSNG
ncbi:hypothetical protein [Rhizobium sp. WYJ-E13]|uniref:hypothetical protein n=1 Tax=Rhizobium sp. WYJ-E13 TaxID=2849093 RepID=UPI001C1E9782|nr:hypothetical protein [Rhizobium sp. WYJ-E13]QWW72497.1 hypothetical protein KQ933_31760 [Rhizobium sp. WYJ-E13]